MYVPPIYRADDMEWHRSVIRDYPLATMVSNGPDFSFATHLPAIFAPDAPPSGDLAGSTLLGHMNRANPHWKSLSDGSRATLIFAGPHGYITPTLYRTTPAAPTWDFVSVHVHGSLWPVKSLDGALEVVERTVRCFERDFGDQWCPVSSADYFREIVPGVGAFTVVIESVDGMFKLSQEKDVEVRHRIIERLAATPDGPPRSLARMMRDLGLGREPGACPANATRD